MESKILSLLLLASSMLAMEPEEKVTQPESEQDIFQSLPPELKVHLFSYAATSDSLASVLKELAHLSLVNRDFHAIAQDPRFIASIAKEYVKHHEDRAYQEFWNALKKGNLKLIELLVNGGVDPDKPSSSSITVVSAGTLPLAFAVNGRKTEIVKLFNKLGTNPNATDKTGSTGLHSVLNYAFFIKQIHNSDLSKQIPSILALCDNPSLSWQIPNNQGETAADLAKRLNLFDSSEIGNVLQKCLYEHRNVLI